MILTSTYRLGVYPDNKPLHIKLGWRSNSIRVKFQLYAGEHGILDIPSGASVVMMGRDGTTPKGVVGSYALTDGIPTVTIDLPSDVISEVGMNEFELVLVSGNYCLSTATFILDVQ